MEKIENFCGKIFKGYYSKVSFCLVNLLLVLMVLVPEVSHAYFQLKGEEIHFLKAGYKVNDDKNANTFALYGNFNSGRIDKEQILFPKSKFFISADFISLSFPLSIAFYNHTSTDNALADLLYANLKMKKLVEEYKDIQKRSKKLIWDSQHLFQQRDNIFSIYQAAKEVKESYLQITDDASTSLTFKANTLVANRIRSFRPGFDRNKQLRPNFNSSFNKGNSNNNRTAQSNSYADKDEEIMEEENANVPRKIRTNPYKNTSDPFIIRFFTKLTRIIPYFIAHKGEAIFYGIGLTLVFLFFSSILKR